MASEKKLKPRKPTTVKTVVVLSAEEAKALAVLSGWVNPRELER